MMIRGWIHNNANLIPTVEFFKQWEAWWEWAMNGHITGAAHDDNDAGDDGNDVDDKGDERKRTAAVALIWYDNRCGNVYMIIIIVIHDQ
jgi:hypothetical protein